MRAKVRMIVLAAGTALPLLQVPPALAYDRPGEVASLTQPGADAHSWSPSISADGRFVAFVSQRDDLVPGDTNGAWDVFWSDRERGEIRRVSVASDGAEADGDSMLPALSPDGGTVAFSSHATNLGPGNPARWANVYVHDVATGATELASRLPSGGPIADIAFVGEVSDGGRHVLIDAYGDGLVPEDDNGLVDVFLLDRSTGSMEWISRPTATVPRDGDTLSSAISADGRYVAYGSISLAESLHEAPDLDLNSTTEVFLLDRVTGTRRIVSRGTGAFPGNGFSMEPDVSNDGRFVSFWSFANNLVPTDTNGVADIFVADAQTGRIERVNVSSIGEQANAVTQTSSLSPDGRYVAFSTRASNLVPGDTNGQHDVFLHDRTTGVTERVSVGATGQQLQWGSSDPMLSDRARFVAFTGVWSSFGVSLDTEEIFVRDRGPELGVGRTELERRGADVRVRGWISMSGGTVTSSTDPAGDVGAAQAAAGGDLVGASLAYSPEARRLVARIDLADMPGTKAPLGDLTSLSCNAFTCAPSASSGPGMLHGLRFDLDGVRHELRISLGSIIQSRGFAKYLLFRCAPECTGSQIYDGVYGTTRLGLEAYIPLTNFTVANAPKLTNITAFSAHGTADTGVAQPIDELAVPDGTYRTPALSAATGQAGGPPPAEAFDPIPQTDGRFDAVVAAPGGAGAVWLRTCVLHGCTSTRVLL